MISPINTCHSINCHVQHFPGPHNSEQPVNALENSHHHLILILWWRLIFRMCARVNDTVHVKVQVVKLHPVGVGEGRICVYQLAIYVDWLKSEIITQNSFLKYYHTYLIFINIDARARWEIKNTLIY